ncbi:MAG TPA: hypothetical protein VGE69_13885, partial [Pseudomonadales bacterium]
MAQHPSTRATARVHFRSLVHPSGIPLCMLALAITAAGGAQAAQPDPEPDTQVEEITITGSRIQRVNGLETPTPVTAVSLSNLADMNPRQMVEGLSQLPQFLNNQRPQTTGGL